MFNSYVENFISIHFSYSKDDKVISIKDVNAKVYDYFEDILEYKQWAYQYLPIPIEATIYHFGVMIHGINESIMFVQFDSNESFQKAIDGCFKKIEDAIRSVPRDIIEEELNHG